MGYRAGWSGTERAAKCLASWLGPRCSRLQVPMNARSLTLQPAFLALRGSQRPIDTAVILEKLFATLQTDKTALGNPIDLFAEGDDLIFQVPNSLAGLELRQALLQQGAHPLPKRGVPEIEHCVVANGERGLDRVELAGSDVEGLAEGKPGRVGHDDVPEGVHATAARPACH